MVDAKAYQKMHAVSSDTFPEQPIFSHDTMQNDEPPHDFALLLPHVIHGFGLNDKKWSVFTFFLLAHDFPVTRIDLT